MSDQKLELANPPLMCVVARIEVTLIPKLESVIGDIQEKLRRKGYPFLFDPSESTELTFTQKNEIKLRKKTHWDIGNRDKTVLFRLEENQLTIFFSSYSDFADAYKHHSNFWDAIAEYINPITVIRYHLRYVNYMPISEGESNTDWLKPTLLGMPNFGNFQRTASVNETSLKTPEGNRLLIKCSTFPAGQTIPPNLTAIPLQWRYPAMNDSAFAILELTQSKNVNNEEFLAEQVTQSFKELKENLNIAFQEIVPKTVIEKWT